VDIANKTLVDPTRIAIMDNLVELIERLTQHPHVANKLSLHQLILFIDLCCQLRPLLEVVDELPHETLPPLKLNENVSLFLGRSLSHIGTSIDSNTISDTWDAFSHVVWSMPSRRASADALLPIFLEFGTPLGIGEMMISLYSIF
jgi:DNA-binding transcriptional ArsR family regulator